MDGRAGDGVYGRDTLRDREGGDADRRLTQGWTLPVEFVLRRAFCIIGGAITVLCSGFSGPAIQLSLVSATSRDELALQGSLRESFPFAGRSLRR